MVSQKIFDFGFDVDAMEADYVVSAANSDAYSYIRKWPDWKHPCVFIYGPVESGKTHLAKLWQQWVGATFYKPLDVYRNANHWYDVDDKAVVLDGIETFSDEVALLHFLNAARERGVSVLMTGTKHPKNLGVRLPDLRSRLNALPIFSLSSPDDPLVRVVLAKSFADRQLKVSKEVIDFLAPRVERSYDAIAQIVSLIDAQSMESQKNITIPFVKSLLDQS